MRIRTADPLLAKQVLYQLSYTPKLYALMCVTCLFIGSFTIITSIACFVKRFNVIFRLISKNF